MKLRVIRLIGDRIEQAALPALVMKRSESGIGAAEHTVERCSSRRYLVRLPGRTYGEARMVLSVCSKWKFKSISASTTVGSNWRPRCHISPVAARR